MISSKSDNILRSSSPGFKHLDDGTPPEFLFDSMTRVEADGMWIGLNLEADYSQIYVFELFFTTHRNSGIIIPKNLYLKDY